VHAQASPFVASETECDDDAVLKCFAASGATCQDFNATLDGGLADDETCCESRREIFNCTEPPRVEPTYIPGQDGKPYMDGYTYPYITVEQFEQFVDPQSENWGKLLIQFPTEYMRSQPSLGRKADEVFVRGIAAYIEGANVPAIEGADVQATVSLTATGEMTNQVRKSNDYIDQACYGVDTSCLFDDYGFTGAPSGQAYGSNNDNTVVYSATYWNVDPETGDCPGAETKKAVFSETKKAMGTSEADRLYYCTNADFEQTYQNSHLSNDPSGPYNSASLFTNFELSVTSDASPRPTPFGRYGIDLRGVTAIHIGFWLMTTDAPDGPDDQCSEMCSTPFTGNCAGVKCPSAFEETV